MKRARLNSKSSRPNRLSLAWWRRSARKGESFIQAYSFPPHLSRRVRRHYPQLGDSEWKQVERGLREWFICCAWRGRSLLGMPSRVVDDAWHEFILDSVAYTAFCSAALGGYLHHSPDETMSTPMAEALGNTIRAWDRSNAGANRESVLWELDEKLGISEPLGINGLQLSAVRSDRSVIAAAGMAGCGGGAGDGGAGDSGGGSGGGGCGGGCGGGS